MDRFGVIWNTEKAETGEIAGLIAQYLKERNTLCTISEDGSDLPEDCRLAIVLGGDGTLLRAAKVVLDAQTPLLGVNLGNLGFLAEVEIGGMYQAIDRLLAGSYTVEKRMMLHGTVYKGNARFSHDLALNDIVLNRIKPLRAYRILNYVNDAYLNTYSADGVIIATATGSTGYNLSVGGPIVSPDAELILMTPLASHSLISRSIIFSGTDKIRIEVGEGRTGQEEEAVSVSFDGSGNIHLGTGDSVEIRKSGKYTNIIKMNNISFLEVLRRKMADA